MTKYKLFFLVALISTIPQIGFSQIQKKVKISNSIEMTNNIDAAWTMVSNLANLGVLVPEIVTNANLIGNGKGSVVILTLKSNGLEVVEKVIKLDNKQRLLIYKMLVSPMPITNYKAKIRVDLLTSGIYKVHFDATFKVADEYKEALKRTINTFQTTFLTNLKRIINDEK